MNITFNGETIRINQDNLLVCLQSQNIDTDKKGVAVAVNNAVVSRKDWTSTILSDGDAIEVVRPFQGG